jgi:hypothetical protein
MYPDIIVGDQTPPIVFLFDNCVPTLSKDLSLDYLQEDGFRSFVVGEDFHPDIARIKPGCFKDTLVLERELGQIRVITESPGPAF